MKSDKKAKVVSGQKSQRLTSPERITAQERLRWLVEMLREEFSSFGRSEAQAFREGLLRLIAPDWSANASIDQGLSNRAVEALHRELREVFWGFVAEPPRRWPLPSAFAFLQHSEPGGAFYFSSEGPPETAVRWAVANLLMESGENLLRCPECGTPFVRVRRQEFCSERCAQQVRDQRKAAKRSK